MLRLVVTTKLLCHSPTLCCKEVALSNNKDCRLASYHILIAMSEYSTPPTRRVSWSSPPASSKMKVSRSLEPGNVRPSSLKKAKCAAAELPLGEADADTQPALRQDSAPQAAESGWIDVKKKGGVSAGNSSSRAGKQDRGSVGTTQSNGTSTMSTSAMDNKEFASYVATSRATKVVNAYPGLSSSTTFFDSKKDGDNDKKATTVVCNTDLDDGTSGVPLPAGDGSKGNGARSVSSGGKRGKGARTNAIASTEEKSPGTSSAPSDGKHHGPIEKGDGKKRKASSAASDDKPRKTSSASVDKKEKCAKANPAVSDVSASDVTKEMCGTSVPIDGKKNVGTRAGDGASSKVAVPVNGGKKTTSSSSTSAAKVDKKANGAVVKPVAGDGASSKVAVPVSGGKKTTSSSTTSAAKVDKKASGATAKSVPNDGKQLSTTATTSSTPTSGASAAASPLGGVGLPDVKGIVNTKSDGSTKSHKGRTAKEKDAERCTAKPVTAHGKVTPASVASSSGKRTHKKMQEGAQPRTALTSSKQPEPVFGKFSRSACVLEMQVL
jgi:hypothetical protein